LDPWNQVLIKQPISRYPLCIKTYGFTTSGMNAQFEPKKPRYYHKNASGRRWTEQTWNAYIAQVEHYLALPEPGPKYEIVDDGPEDTRGPDDLLAAMTLAMRNGSAMDELEELMEIKWIRLNTLTYPGAGISYSYEDWKNGKTWKAIIEKRRSKDDIRNNVPVPDPSLAGDHPYRNICLQDTFRTRGLQVIIRVSSIELTPETPCYPGDSDFHVDGLLNEHIVATSRYYYEIENVEESESRISFQQENDLDEWDYTPEPLGHRRGGLQI
jgi:hypothetical protein